MANQFLEALKGKRLESMKKEYPDVYRRTYGDDNSYLEDTLSLGGLLPAQNNNTIIPYANEQMPSVARAPAKTVSESYSAIPSANNEYSNVFGTQVESPSASKNIPTIPTPTTSNQDSGINDAAKYAMLGGVPMLIGALFGETGIGAAQGGKAVLSETDRAYAREKAIFDKQKKGLGNLYKYIDSEGKEKYGTAEEAHRQTPSSVYSTMEARAQDYKNRRVTSKDIALEKKSKEMEMTGEAPVEGLDITQRKAADKYVENFHSKTKANTEALQMIERAKSSIGTGELGTKLGLMAMIKTIESRLSDADRNFYKSFEGRIKALEEQKRRITGTGLNPEIIENAKSLLVDWENKANSFNKHFADSYSSNLEDIHGVPRSKSRKFFDSYKMESTEKIKVRKPDGTEGLIPAQNKDAALSRGWEVLE